MSVKKTPPDVNVQHASVDSDASSLLTIRRADDALLAELGYKAEFRREFSVSSIVYSRKSAYVVF